MLPLWIGELNQPRTRRSIHPKLGDSLESTQLYSITPWRSVVDDEAEKARAVLEQEGYVVTAPGGKESKTPAV